MDESWTLILWLGEGSWLGRIGDIFYVGNETRPQRELDPETPTGLLACLERPYEVVRAELEAREIELSMAPGTLLSAVPLARIPSAAVATEMDYWASLALSWVASRPASVVDHKVILAIEESSWASQSSKHRACSLRRRSSE